MSLRRALAFCLALGSGLISAAAEGDLDDLFQNPIADQVVEAPEADHRAVFERWDGIRWTGRFTTEAGLSLGWTDWPVPADPGLGFDGSLGLKSAASLSFAARPTRSFSVQGTLGSTFNPLDGKSGAWTAPSFETLYADYVLNEALFVRMGKHALSWGQGRLFNPANLVSDASSAYALRISAPSYAGAQLLGLMPKGAASYRQLIYAAKADFVVKDIYIGPALRFEFDEPIALALSLKRVILGADLFTDAVVRLDYAAAGFLGAEFLIGIFREFSDLKLYGEYLTEIHPDAPPSHSFGAVIAYKGLGSTRIDAGLEYRHYTTDASGVLIAGLTGPVAQHLRWKLGLPWYYGPEDSAAHTYLQTHDPAGRRISLAFGLSLSASF